MEEPLRCDFCGDVIGVYEPMVVVTAGRPRSTSLLIERSREDDPPEPPVQMFHHSCFANRPAGA